MLNFTKNSNINLDDYIRLSKIIGFIIASFYVPLLMSNVDDSKIQEFFKTDIGHIIIIIILSAGVMDISFTGKNKYFFEFMILSIIIYIVIKTLESMYPVRSKNIKK